MRSRWFWLLLSAVVLLTAVLTAVVWPFPAPQLSQTVLDFWQESAVSLSALLVLPVALLAVVLLALFCLDSGPYTLSKGELDYLIQLKRRGALLHRSARIRESAARISGGPQRTSLAGEVSLGHFTATEHVLDRLLQLKRRGAWAPLVRSM